MKNCYPVQYVLYYVNVFFDSFQEIQVCGCCTDGKTPGGKFEIWGFINKTWI